MDIIYYILIVLGAIVAIPILLFVLVTLYISILWLFARNKPYNSKIVRSGYSFFTWLATKLPRVKYEIQGFENIPEGGFILYPNHQKFTDSFILLYELRKNDLGGVAKNEMMKIPIISQWMKKRGILMLERDNDRQGAKVFVELIRRARKGQPMFLFPEGTRSKTGELLPFRPGAFKLAVKAGVPIVPVVFANFSKQRFYHIRRYKGLVKILKPINPEDYKEMNSIEISNMVRSKIKHELEAHS